MGDGLPPVPAEKISNGEFVEMYELLPEFWTNQGDSERSKQARGKRRVQCAMPICGSISSKIGPRTAISILRASQEYEGSWAI